MKTLKIAVAQFQPKDGDKDYNLSVIDKLTAKAKEGGAEVVSFHEMSITAYTFFKDLSREEVKSYAEKVPEGKSTQKLIEIAAKHDITVLAGLVEVDDEDKLYNTYICVDKNGLKAKYRKIHPFISKYLSPGNEYVVFNIKDWKCGILICYDNNVVENVRATSILGAEIIFAPHVTMCTPSSMPGRGFVDDALWQKRELDPVPLRMEFDGPKGMQWLMRWLPARAYDNGVYYVFTNPIGYDGDQLKNGNSLILDPYGDVMVEIKSFNDEIAIATITEDKLKLSGGWRYKNARKPELYRDIIGAEHNSQTKPVWMEKEEVV
ncbi:MAG TPA: nitrilase family protein [Hanamia sp.]|jgi:predicted amidohydrolase|nr:nitrilase family protein [Hanamia sp.]